MEWRNNMHENQMRKLLIDEYLKVTDGIPIDDITSTLSFIKDTYQNLKTLLAKHIEHIEYYNKCGPIKYIGVKGKECLAIRLGLARYLMIDTETGLALSKEQVCSQWTEDYFLAEFAGYHASHALENDIDQYTFLTPPGNLSDIVDFCAANSTVFALPTTIVHQVKLEQPNITGTVIKTLSYLAVDFIRNEIQLGFRGTDQYLYEHLFFSLDLEPTIKDTKGRIDNEEMNTIFCKVKNIRIPKEAIPQELLAILPQKTKL